jgi:glycosyltransferase involved in cell wall biosynthesis
MKVAILGTRGIPNNYGGFEQLAEFLSVQLVERGHEVWVYNSSLHPYKKEIFKGVNIIACKDPESKVGTFGQFVYDFNCIMDSRKRNFDAIIQLGYTSSSIWWFLLPRKSLIITNMDGLEWKRAKYSFPVKFFLKFAEWLAIKSSHKLVADSIGIQSYLEKKYQVESNFIPYGAYCFETPVFNTLISYNVVPNSYYLLIARFEPENNIETIIKGYIASNTSDPLLIVGSVNNKYAHYIMDKYNSDKIRYMGAIYSMEVLNNLRYYAKMYFHGHSVGGTNPSLLEAMASQVFICAHLNDFNRSVLQDDAVYFSNDAEITAIITTYIGREFKQKAINNNSKKIKEIYTWNNIVTAYEELLV